ncbi:MAG TPA: hypothetical protein VK717_03110 [Opitutaceae bacterium]|jgi:hypothetical protein|nr:hypothetical protein [Opitutaceae bacterium]
MKPPLRSAHFRPTGGNVFFKVLVFLMVLAATFAIAWVLLLPSMVAGVIRKRTGFNASVTSLYANPFTASVNIRQLKIDNPDTFPQPDFVVVNQFRTAVEPSSIFSDRVVVRDALFDVALIAVVKNAAGQTNVEVFKTGVLGANPEKSEATPGQKPEAKPAPEQKKAPKQFLIQHLVVKLDKIILADYSGSTPQVREIPVNINRTFTDVTDLKQISGPLLADLSVAGIGKFAGDVLGLVIPAPLLESLGVVAKGTGGIIQETGKTTTNFIKGLFDSLEEKPKK